MEMFMNRYPITYLKEDFKWPNASKLAVVLTSEYEPVNRIKMLADGHPNYRQEAEIRYEATRGVWRVLEVLRQNKVPSTFFVNGASADRYPESVKAMVADGHEVAAHSWNAEDQFIMPRDKENELIDRVTRVIHKVSGSQPRGWLSPRAQVSEYTIELIVEHGFVWHSDCFDDDLPYIIEVNGQPLVEVPRSTLTDDYAMMGTLTARPLGSPRDMLDTWMDEFEVLWRESRHAPRLLSINWHQCMMGRPAVSKVLDEVINHIQRYEGVWFARGSEVAEFCLKLLESS